MPFFSLGSSAANSAPDASLLERLNRRERAAFEQLVETYQDRIYDFCVRMVTDREEALDLTQETFASVYQHVARFRQEAKLSTWVFRIARNLCLNRLKYLDRRGAGSSIALDAVPDAALQSAEDAPQKPDDALASARERNRVQAAIAQLEEEQRVLVVLRDIEGLSYDEIVGVTDLPEGTVKSRLHRAREKLAEILMGP